MDLTTSPAVATDAGIPAQTDAESTPSPDVMHLLNDHVPLSLLADLTDPEGPRSTEILATEGQPEVAWWEAG